MELEEGVTVLNLEHGKGKKAKIGDIVNIEFQNRLEGSDNIVGQSIDDEGLKFTLGTEGNESVIRGLHIGIVGLKKGGKRKITCPPKTAYGEEGSFFIPPNSTVISEVKLLSIERKAE